VSPRQAGGVPDYRNLGLLRRCGSDAPGALCYPAAFNRGNAMRIAVLVCVVLLCASAHAQQARSIGDLVSGQVTSVADGDKFRIGYDRIRIWGIDVPNWRARCISSGEKWRPAWGSIAALRDCLRGTTVTCRVQKIERRLARPRFIGECWRDKDKEDVAACMVRSGWATDWPGYSGGHYASLEAEPKAARRGLWKCDGEPPTRRWCRGGEGVPCEQPTYKPLGPAQ
jgi:endonuclease YncB( thermonuclease family)